MERLYIASKNHHKALEFQALLATDFPFEVFPLPGEGIPDCPESGHTFEMNAMQKATFYARFVDGWVLADDSGLCVDVLENAPGIYSARYAGIGASDTDNNRKLLQALKDVPEADRTARFVCALSLWNEQLGRGLVARGELHGLVLDAPCGEHGFGYDPLFYLPDRGCSVAQLTPAEKNRVSHRAQAVKSLGAAWRGTWL